MANVTVEALIKCQAPRKNSTADIGDIITIQPAGHGQAADKNKRFG